MIFFFVSRYRSKVEVFKLNFLGNTWVLLEALRTVRLSSSNISLIWDFYWEIAFQPAPTINFRRKLFGMYSNRVQHQNPTITPNTSNVLTLLPLWWLSGWRPWFFRLISQPSPFVVACQQQLWHVTVPEPGPEIVYQLYAKRFTKWYMCCQKKENRE